MLYFNKLHRLFIVYIVHIGGFCKNKEDFKDENPKITCPNYDNSTCFVTVCLWSKRNGKGHAAILKSFSGLF